MILTVILTVFLIILIIDIFILLGIRYLIKGTTKKGGSEDSKPTSVSILQKYAISGVGKSKKKDNEKKEVIRWEEDGEDNY